MRLSAGVQVTLARTIFRLLFVETPAGTDGVLVGNLLDVIEDTPGAGAATAVKTTSQVRSKIRTLLLEKVPSGELSVPVALRHAAERLSRPADRYENALKAASAQQASSDSLCIGCTSSTVTPSVR